MYLLFNSLVPPSPCIPADFLLRERWDKAGINWNILIFRKLYLWCLILLFYYHTVNSEYQVLYDVKIVIICNYVQIMTDNY